MVIVTLNHRLNIFGFLYAPEHGVAPNLGMQDIVVALRWVQENIAGFGGDAGNVTIFGQSGGGMKVSTLMAMPVSARPVPQGDRSERTVAPSHSARTGAVPLPLPRCDFLGIGPDNCAKFQPPICCGHSPHPTRAHPVSRGNSVPSPTAKSCRATRSSRMRLPTARAFPC